MTLTIDISPEAEARLEQDATKRGQDPIEYARKSFEIWLNLSTIEPESDEKAFQEMRALSLPSMEEYWLNEQDSVYDNL